MHDITDWETKDLIPVSRSILHEDFRTAEVHEYNDIAILELEKPIVYSKTVGPICLPSKGIISPL